MPSKPKPKPHCKIVPTSIKYGSGWVIMCRKKGCKKLIVRGAEKEAIEAWNK